MIRNELGIEMVADYVSDVSQWERWQQGYRFGVLLLFPPEPLLTQVNALRAQYDPPSQLACDAHISLTVPLPRPLSRTDWCELESIISIVESFAVHYGPLKHSLPHHPGVTLAIEPQEQLDRLRIVLEAASVFAGASVRKYPFSAHMTIAEFITVEQTKVIMDELKEVAPQGVFTCTSVAYAVPDANFHFTERKRLELVPKVIQSEH